MLQRTLTNRPRNLKSFRSLLVHLQHNIGAQVQKTNPFSEFRFESDSLLKSCQKTMVHPVKCYWLTQIDQCGFDVGFYSISCQLGANCFGAFFLSQSKSSQVYLSSSGFWPKSLNLCSTVLWACNVQAYTPNGHCSFSGFKLINQMAMSKHRSKRELSRRPSGIVRWRFALFNLKQLTPFIV